jgi:hypothetical protein
MVPLPSASNAGKHGSASHVGTSGELQLPLARHIVLLLPPLSAKPLSHEYNEIDPVVPAMLLTLPLSGALSSVEHGAGTHAVAFALHCCVGKQNSSCVLSDALALLT